VDALRSLDRRFCATASDSADVKARARLRPGLDETTAADVVWVLNDPVHYDMLVRVRGWSDEQFQAWLTRALETELVGRSGL